MLTCSIVLYHSLKKDIVNLIDCLEKSCIEIIYIIDNSSNDLFRFLEKQSIKIRYIHNDNIGYGASHNIALHEAIDEGSQFHLIINLDVKFSPDIIKTLLFYMNQNDDVVYIIPRVINPDGTEQYLCKLLPTPFDLLFRRFIPNMKLTQKLNDKYILRNSGYDKIINPPCLSGCFMFLRVSTIKEFNIFFDERYFMYCEDFDLIRRLHNVGKTIYYPHISIIHEHAKESYKLKKMTILHIKSAAKYFNKWGWFFDKERKFMNKKILEEIKNMNK